MNSTIVRHKFKAQLVSIVISLLFLQACGSSQGTTSPPDWAPAYTDGGYIPYYYFPDYAVYYDVAAQQYYYQNQGVWVSSPIVPYNLDLDHSYTVLLNHNVSTPWLNHSYYERNYPPHAYERYVDIVSERHVIQNVPPEHVITPRAYNENNDRLLFEERVRAQAKAPPPAPAQAAPQLPPGARIATHEVPMRSVGPSMPVQSHDYKYGGAAKGR